MNMFGVLSYAAAALAYLLLTVLLLVSWRRPGKAAYIIGAASATTLWAATLSVQRLGGQVSPALTYFLEVLRDAGWLLVLAGMAWPRADVVLNRFGPRLVAGLLAASAVGFLSLPLWDRADSEVWRWRIGSVCAVAGLVLIARWYRHASQPLRGELRFFMIGIAALFAYDLFLYVQAEMLGGIVAGAWDARGLLNASAVPLIALAVRRSLSSTDIFVSRQVIFHTAVISVAMIYLFLVALVWRYLTSVGTAWGAPVEILISAGALIFLLVAVLGASWRRHLRVFIAKHFYRNKYDYRIEWLRFVNTLSAAGSEDVGRRSVRAIAQIFSSPGGIVFTLDSSGRRFMPFSWWPDNAGHALEIAAVRQDSDLVRLLSEREWVIDLHEYRSTPTAYEGVRLPEWLCQNLQLRIVSPLFLSDRLAGFIVLLEPPAPFELTYEDRDLLKTVGRHVATYISQHEADRRLAESKQFEAYNRLTAFMMHDLKNSVAQLQLVVENAERHRRNPAFVDDAIETIANAVGRMTRLIEQLCGTASSPKSAVVSLTALTRQVVMRCSNRMPKPVFHSGDGSVHVLGDADRIASMIEHLIRNAQDATMGRAEGVVRVDLRREADEALLVIADTGTGMEAEFVRERLFRPFDSTKGSKGMGIGAYQVREYVHMLGGEIEVQSSPARGTTFCIRLPMSADAVTPVAAPQVV